MTTRVTPAQAIVGTISSLPRTRESRTGAEQLTYLDSRVRGNDGYVGAPTLKRSGRVGDGYERDYTTHQLKHPNHTQKQKGPALPPRARRTLAWYCLDELRLPSLRPPLFAADGFAACIHLAERQPHRCFLVLLSSSDVLSSDPSRTSSRTCCPS